MKKSIVIPVRLRIMILVFALMVSFTSLYDYQPMVLV